MARESWSTVGGQRTNKAREVLWVLSPPGAARARVCASGKGLSLYQFTLPGRLGLPLRTGPGGAQTTAVVVLFTWLRGSGGTVVGGVRRGRLA